MKYQEWKTKLLVGCAALALMAGTQSVSAQVAEGAAAQAATQATHTLTLNNAKQTVDATGRIVLVANVKGDLPGTLTLALTVSPSGAITGGQWALNVSYIKFGAPEVNGDGDESEGLVQLGVLKGTVTSGVAARASNGVAAALNGLQLNLTGATVQFAKASKGTGSLNGGSLNNPSASTGSLTITF